MAIYDTMKFIKAPVSTLCLGQAASMAAVLPGGGGKGQTLQPAPCPGADSPTLGRKPQGQATDIEIHAREILRMREELNQILADHTGQSLDKISIDTERDFFMSGVEAKQYGIVDEVITHREVEET